MVDNIINVEQNATGQLAGLIREFGDTIPIGVLYQEEAPNFHQRNPILSKGSPLYKRELDKNVLEELIREFV